MLTDSLFNTGRFIGGARAPGYTRTGSVQLQPLQEHTAAPIGQPGVADPRPITESEPNCSGVPSYQASTKQACVSINIRVLMYDRPRR